MFFIEPRVYASTDFKKVIVMHGPYVVSRDSCHWVRGIPFTPGELSQIPLLEGDKAFSLYREAIYSRAWKEEKEDIGY